MKAVGHRVNLLFNMHLLHADRAAFHLGALRVPSAFPFHPRC